MPGCPLHAPLCPPCGGNRSLAPHPGHPRSKRKANRLRFVSGPQKLSVRALVSHCPVCGILTKCKALEVPFTKIFKNAFIILGCTGSFAARGLSLSSFNEQGLLPSCGVWASHGDGFSCCRARAVGHRVNSCGTQA